MADFTIIEEVVPELKSRPEAELRKRWREWVNNQPDVTRRWLMTKLTPLKRRTLQCGFAADYYQTEMMLAYTQHAQAEDDRFEETNGVVPEKKLSNDDGLPAPKTLDMSDLDKLAHPLDKMARRTLPDGQILYAPTEDEADALVQQAIRKATYQAPDPETGESFVGGHASSGWDAGGRFVGGGASGGWDDGSGAAAAGGSDASGSADTSSSSSDGGSSGGDS